MRQTVGIKSMFVHCLRESAPYVRRHHGRLFVLHIDESLLDRETLRAVCKDLLLLHQLQVRLIVVFGIRSIVDRMLRERGGEPKYNGVLRVTDLDAMACVREVSARVRDDMESMLSTVSSNAAMPIDGGRIMARVVCGNYVVARPAGVIDGCDCQYTGYVRSVDVEGIASVTSGNSILLMPPLGYGNTGEMFNLHAASLASEVAVAVAADKLVFLGRGRLYDSSGAGIAEMQLPQARVLWHSGVVAQDMQQRLELAIEACAGGVPRVHFVDQDHDGALLLEMYSRDGGGTLISSASFDEIRPAKLDDLTGILQLIEPLSSQGMLMPRPRQRLEDRLPDFTVLVRDGLVVACAALRCYDDELVAEVECLAVHPRYQGMGKGRILHKHLLRQAQGNGMERILVLTTQALHWFYDLGYSDCDSSVMPAAKAGESNLHRGSKILVLDIAAKNMEEEPLPLVG
ncbi:MAG: amino-acid N-acetyltransferase [Candidatus Porifericomitaceae bacterium WSBS_2022_MAG_OTU9]